MRVSLVMLAVAVAGCAAPARNAPTPPAGAGGCTVRHDSGVAAYVVAGQVRAHGGLGDSPPVSLAPDRTTVLYDGSQPVGTYASHTVSLGSLGTIAIGSDGVATIPNVGGARPAGTWTERDIALGVGATSVALVLARSHWRWSRVEANR